MHTNFDSAQLRSKAASGRRNCIPQTAIARRTHFPQARLCRALPPGPARKAQCVNARCSYMMSPPHWHRQWSRRPPQAPLTVWRLYELHACGAQGKTLSSLSSRAGRKHWRSSGSTTHMQPLLLRTTYSNLNRLQLRSKAAPGARNCSPRTAIARRTLLVVREAVPRASPRPPQPRYRAKQQHRPLCSDATQHGVSARRRRRSRCTPCVSDRLRGSANEG